MTTSTLPPAPPAHGDEWRYQLPAQAWVAAVPWSPEDTDPAAYPRLEWRMHEPGDEAALWADASGPCLDDFIRLDDGPADELPERVLRIVERWGALRICAHGKPHGHHPDCAPLVSPPQPQDRVAATWEPIEAWRRYSKQLEALLSIAAELQQGRPGRDGDWRAVAAGEPDGAHPLTTLADRPPAAPPLEDWQPPPGADVALQRAILTRSVNRWYQYGRVAPHASWPEEGGSPSSRLAFDGLPGVLAIQLAEAVTSSRGLHRCVGCNRAFTPPAKRRRPRRGTRPWCGHPPACDRAAQKRDWDHRHGR